MNDESHKFNPSGQDTETTAYIIEATNAVVKRLLESCLADECFDHIDSRPIPLLESVARIIQQARSILFPGYFTANELASSNLQYCLRQETRELLENVTKQIVLSMQYDCLRNDQACSACNDIGYDKALNFIQALPRLRTLLAPPMSGPVIKETRPSRVTMK